MAQGLQIEAGRGGQASKGVRAMLLALALGSAVAILGGRWLARNTSTRGIVRRLDELQVQVTAWQAAHRVRMRALERQMTDIELSVACAEEDAHAASLQMVEIRSNLLYRLEHVEQRIEIELLVAQGRIPPEHLPF